MHRYAGYQCKIASIRLPAGKSKIMVVISVNDVGDKIYDSAAIIDRIRLK
jgi:hypothetical protein